MFSRIRSVSTLRSHDNCLSCYAITVPMVLRTDLGNLRLKHYLVLILFFAESVRALLGTVSKFRGVDESFSICGIADPMHREIKMYGKNLGKGRIALVATDGFQVRPVSRTTHLSHTRTRTPAHSLRSCRSNNVRRAPLRTRH